MFFREFEALTANTLFLPLSWLDHIYWKHIHTCTHSALRLLAIISDFASLCPSTHSLCPRIWIWQTKGNVFLYIWHICSQQFPALLFIYFPSLYPISYSWMRQCRHYPFFFPVASMNSQGAKASLVRTPVWWIVMEGDIAQFWHIGNARSAIFISADGSPITL